MTATPSIPVEAYRRAVAAGTVHLLGQGKAGPAPAPAPRLAGLAAVAPTPAPRYRSKTEAAYALHLEGLRIAGEIVSFGYERITLRLARRTRYTPDFDVVCPDGRIELHEVKGFWRDDARVKWKVAAELFPMFGFVAVTKTKGGWRLEEPR